MRELTSWEIYQLERWGDILPEPNLEIEEPGERELERFYEWSGAMYERQLHEYDDQYTNTRY